MLNKLEEKIEAILNRILKSAQPTELYYGFIVTERNILLGQEKHFINRIDSIQSISPELCKNPDSLKKMRWDLSNLNGFLWDEDDMEDFENIGTVQEISEYLNTCIEDIKKSIFVTNDFIIAAHDRLDLIPSLSRRNVSSSGLKEFIQSRRKMAQNQNVLGEKLLQQIEGKWSSYDERRSLLIELKKQLTTA